MSNIKFLFKIRRFLINSEKIVKVLSYQIGWKAKWFNWTKYSPKQLFNTEKEILSYLNFSYKGIYVNIGSIVGENDQIWTIIFNEKLRNTPVVMLHGLGGGVALWVMNFDDLATDRPIYALDLLGFGRSSRPKFGSDPRIIELQMVSSLEEWRRKIQLDKFILLGHSLGGYFATLYAMQYPERVKHLILADPWGFPVRPKKIYNTDFLPLWCKIIFRFSLPLNPLFMIRIAGPWGENMISKSSDNVATKFSSILPNSNYLITKYIHQCNCQKPSGEDMFYVLMHNDWMYAKNPIVQRLHRCHNDIGMTFILGENTWVDNSVKDYVKETLKNVDIYTIANSSHQMYLDQPNEFNKLVSKICEKIDYDAIQLKK